ncbi:MULTISPECIES: oxygen-insensitive NAD(P)H nitroreductase [unclassified Psychrobacter]|uniref:oxygen-insensitive NAD(P)H nitroreductase n=1 Tax=unclassified Psychrobacter TaxID=196806 RepID=UPI0025B29BCB|nr:MULTISPECIES: oxygen-insensitive NAD(P)H nitroreductase [unclassified Psychrobacter]MDN3453137.1 oxygen-insensitive NAD(P)H nitroreductase [Psychrobacter sp. APC 3350]MDN3501620.1 oxygen-insensitive NAD(P)H nitroreductase [Psychrobacter sp. 5A.1]
MKNITEAMNWRYSTKVFDTDKKISAEDFQSLKDILRLSPSSTNIQPWHFVIADDEAGKARIAKGTDGMYGFNTAKVKNASHVIVFCSRVYADDAFLDAILEKEDADGRFAEPQFKEQMHQVRKMFLDMRRYEQKDEPHWLIEQLYLNMGALLLGAATLGIDAVPMEGADLKALDEEFDLRRKGYTAVAMVALGYRSEDDFNAELTKSRFDEETIITKA